MARPSRHPAVIRYHESEDVRAAIGALADGAQISFAEAQRLITRAGLEVLRPKPELVG